MKEKLRNFVNKFLKTIGTYLGCSNIYKKRRLKGSLMTSNEDLDKLAG